MSSSSQVVPLGSASELLSKKAQPKLPAFTSPQISVRPSSPPTAATRVTPIGIVRVDRKKVRKKPDIKEHSQEASTSSTLTGSPVKLQRKELALPALNLHSVKIEREESSGSEVAIPIIDETNFLVKHLKEMKQPTLKKFFQEASKSLEGFSYMSNDHILSKTIETFVVSKSREIAIHVLLETDILFRPCIQRWQKMETLFQIYLLHVKPKQLKKQSEDIQHFRGYVTTLIKLKETGLRRFLEIMEGLPPKFPFKKMILNGVFEQSTELGKILGNLKTSMHELQQSLAFLNTSRSYSYELSLRDKKSYQEKEEDLTSHHTVPGPKFLREALLSGSGSE